MAVIQPTGVARLVVNVKQPTVEKQVVVKPGLLTATANCQSQQPSNRPWYHDIIQQPPFQSVYNPMISSQPKEAMASLATPEQGMSKPMTSHMNTDLPLPNSALITAPIEAAGPSRTMSSTSLQLSLTSSTSDGQNPSSIDPLKMKIVENKSGKFSVKSTKSDQSSNKQPSNIRKRARSESQDEAGDD